jgi:hypothetical protein
MTLPPKVSTRGGGTVGITAATWNQLIDYLKSTRVVPNIHVRPLVTSQGTILTTTAKRAKFPSTPLPWEIVGIVGKGEPDTNGKYSNYEASVWSGTVAGILPSNVFEDGLLKKFTFSSTLQKWKAKCLTDGKKITSVEIVVDDKDPPAQTLVASALPAEAWFVFGVTFEGASYRTIGPTNPSVTLNQAVVTDKTTAPPPGVPGVDRWYSVIFS